MSSENQPIEDLRRRLSEAEQTIKALLSGEVDAIAVGARNDPLLLRAAQEDLRNSQQRFAAVFENSTDCICLFDEAGHYVEVNEAACELLETSREELLGQRVDAFVGGREVGAVNLSWIVERGRVVAETEITTARGRKRLVEYRAVANILPGLHMSMFRDVTDARAGQAASARLAAIVTHRMLPS